MKYLAAFVIGVGLMANGPAFADFNLTTIGHVRGHCKAWLSDSPDTLYVNSGACMGWVVAEANWRYAACLFVRNGADVGFFAREAARDTTNHSYLAMAQAFVNWSDENPQLWSKELVFMTRSPDFWSEFPCE
jgi:hypothetical protein